MFQGTLEAIFIGPAKGEPMWQVQSALAMAGCGLEGDRYSVGRGTFSKSANARGETIRENTGRASGTQKADRQITLIEAEALEAAARDYELKLAAAEMRRNLLVRGVPLDHLVGREFSIGPVRLRGIKLCEPCGYLEKLTVDGIQAALRHRGGLRGDYRRRRTAPWRHRAADIKSGLLRYITASRLRSRGNKLSSSLAATCPTRCQAQCAQGRDQERSGLGHRRHQHDIARVRHGSRVSDGPTGR